MAAPVVDYPFANWTDYFKTLSQVFSTEFFGRTYPEYERVYEDEGGEADLRIITRLLEAGANPQEGFDGLLKTCIIYHRYSFDFVNDDVFPSILRAFFDRGVRLNLDILTAIYIATECDEFEDEAGTCNVRARLIFALKSFGIDIISQLNSLINWNDIIPVCWEDTLDSPPTTMEGLSAAIYSAVKYEYNDIQEDNDD
jgi:hypothetical protein